MAHYLCRRSKYEDAFYSIPGGTSEKNAIGVSSNPIQKSDNQVAMLAKEEIELYKLAFRGEVPHQASQQQQQNSWFSKGLLCSLKALCSPAAVFFSTWCFTSFSPGMQLLIKFHWTG
jgi:hypothetical protein